MEVIGSIDNTAIAETRENRTRAQILLDRIKRENKRKKFVRVPLPDGKGFREIELEKYLRQTNKQ
jgi:hypothetical protein